MNNRHRVILIGFVVATFGGLGASYLALGQHSDMAHNPQASARESLTIESSDKARQTEEQSQGERPEVERSEHVLAHASVSRDVHLLDPKEKIEPHPQSPERDRILRERHLVELAKDAVKNRDVSHLRQVLTEHSEAGISVHFVDFHEAFSTIADCLEERNDSALARAARFIEEQQGSTHRRRVRRYCQVE